MQPSTPNSKPPSPDRPSAFSRLTHWFKRMIQKYRSRGRFKVRIIPIQDDSDLIPRSPQERRIVFNGRVIITRFIPPKE